MRKWPINPSPNEGETHLEDNTPDTQDSSTISVTVDLDVLEALIDQLNSLGQSFPMLTMAMNAANEARSNAEASVNEQAHINRILSPKEA